MSPLQSGDRVASELTIWFDPVCPFTWNTARWLKTVADDGGPSIDWRLMSLAVLNEGREQSPEQQAHMRDSRQVGRLMAAIRDKHGTGDMVTAYFAFGEQFFDRSNSVHDSLTAEVCKAVGGRDAADSVISDESYDDPVRRSHQAGQDALGESGGSPIVQIDGKTFFGPVLTEPPAPQMCRAMLEAFAVLAAVPEFTQLKRPQTSG
jgi:hypothetical protein